MKMAMAAIPHDVKVSEKYYLDIAAWNLFALSKNETDPEVVSFRNHPDDSAEYVKSIKNLPPDIDQIIILHHERPDGPGFPGGLNSTRISHLSSLFIMAEDLQDLILKFVKLDEAYNSGNLKNI